MKNTIRFTVLMVMILLLVSGCSKGESNDAMPSPDVMQDQTVTNTEKTATTATVADQEPLSQLTGSIWYENDGWLSKIDYMDEKTFEKDLNSGKDLKGKNVIFKVQHIYPDHANGYNMWAGEHLNMLFPDYYSFYGIKTGDYVIGTVKKVEKIDNGSYNSWMVYLYKESSSSYDWNSGSDFDDIDWSSLLNDPTPMPTTKPTEVPVYTYEDNPYFEVVERYTFGSYIFDKVLGKADNKKIEASMLVYDDEGDVIDKCSGEITVNSGCYNYIRYNMDVTEYDHYDISFKASSSWRGGDADAVKMVKYKVVGKNVMVTLEQVGEIGSFSQFKLLFLKDGKIVDYEEWYFDIKAKGLNGKGTTDVAEISCNKEFDTIEYFYEP